MPSSAPFCLEALVDFPDDATEAESPITPRSIDAMMKCLAASGVRRVSWATYGDGHGGYFLPDGLDRGWQNYARTLDLLENPLRVAVEAGHRHGIEVYGYFKPYETGPAVLFPEGAPEARAWGRLRQAGGYLTWLDPFVVDHPALRIRRRTDDGPAVPERAPVCAIRLVKRDDRPTRITKDRVQIWTSDLNYRYRRLPAAFDWSETVERAERDVYDIEGKPVTRQGDPVRVLTLSGLRLTDRYILVTTDFQEGPGDFEHTGTDLMRALDAQGREMPGVFATGAAIWEGNRADFRHWGLLFDYGWGRRLIRLDDPYPEAPASIGYGTGRHGVIAYTRGYNAYLPGALCETEPAVQAYWLAWVREMIEAGVDGVDLRVENHSTHTDYPEAYGFNQIILDRAAALQPHDPAAAVARVRGAAYTGFLRDAKRLLAAHGKRMRINLNIDFFRPDPPAQRLPAYPLNIAFDWRQWVQEGLLDEGILRFFHFPFDGLFDDPTAQEMIRACQGKGIPLCVNRYISSQYEEEFTRVRRDGRFSGFVLYETAGFLKQDGEDAWNVTSPAVEAVLRAWKKEGV